MYFLTKPSQSSRQAKLFLRYWCWKMASSYQPTMFSLFPTSVSLRLMLEPGTCHHMLGTLIINLLFPVLFLSLQSFSDSFKIYTPITLLWEFFHSTVPWCSLLLGWSPDLHLGFQSISLLSLVSLQNPFLLLINPCSSQLGPLRLQSLYHPSHPCGFVYCVLLQKFSSSPLFSMPSPSQGSLLTC